MRTILLQPYSIDYSHLSPAYSSTVINYLQKFDCDALQFQQIRRWFDQTFSQHDAVHHGGRIPIVTRIPLLRLIQISSEQKDMYCVQSPDIEDEEAGGDRAEHPIASTTLATIAMVARIRAASGFLDTKVAGYMRDAPIFTTRVHTHDDGRYIFQRLPPEILTEILVLLLSASVQLVLQEWKKGKYRD